MSLPAYEKLGAFYLGRQVTDQGQDTDDLVMYDARDLTTHAVCVGMTGSGKTGLCLSVLEEAAIDGIPVLAIDPKGDIANLALQFPQLRSDDFLPWVDAGEARRKGQTPESYAEATAANWRKGLADWGQDGERITRLMQAAEVAIYTPGSSQGRPLSVLRSFAAPDVSLRADANAMKERITGAVSGVLGLVGVQADPLKSREHILLSNLLQQAWQAGRDVDLPTLIALIQKPGFDKVGVMDLDTFYPPRERMELAMSINNLLASPGFSAWLEGEALDMSSLLFTAAGKPKLCVVSIAHLNDAERMFVVTLLLNEVVSWMRRQSGTSALRALVYMDEIFGYFPPSAAPPSKLPLLTLMKQARAFGVGVMLATQNPVDLDYKGLSNAGTWFIGRLQTERDKARVIDGLLGSAGDGLDKARIEALLANLQQRVFLMRNAHEAEPVLLRTRWALSYLRGPMTLHEIAQLKQAVPTSDTAASAKTSAPVNAAASKPALPSGVNEYFTAAAANATYVPALLGVVKVHFVDAKAGVDVWQTQHRVMGFDDQGQPDWDSARVLAEGKDNVTQSAAAAASFAELPATCLRAASYATWSKALSGHVYETASLVLSRCDAVKASANIGESEAEFRARLALSLREQRDAAVDRLRKQYAPRLQTLQDQLLRAQQKAEKEAAQLSQQKMQTALSVGATILGALLGRKVASASNLSRVATAARSASRISRESQDVDQATSSIETVQQRLADLNAELESEMARIQGELDPASLALTSVTIKARKSDIVVNQVALIWCAV